MTCRTFEAVESAPENEVAPVPPFAMGTVPVRVDRERQFPAMEKHPDRRLIPPVE